MNKLAIVIVFVAAAVAIIVFAVRRGGDDRKPSTPAPTATADAAPAGQPVKITFEYSTEKKDWLDAAVADFEAAHPRIDVELVGKGSLDAAQAILDGTDQPVLWSPADSLIANLFASDWETKHGKRPYAASGEQGPQPLVLTPLVFVIWEDRANALLRGADNSLSWKTIHKAVTSPKGWAAVGGKPAWGFVKLGHTDPTRSNSGLQALLLMTLEYYGKTTGLEVKDLLDEKYQAWIRDIERAVPKFETSTGTFMTDMVRFGPSKYDVAVVYESLAVSQLENAQGRWGNLRVVYPSVTLWSDHPVVLLDAPWVTAEQRAAAVQLIAYLRSPEVQTTALRHGFRPADPSVPMRSPEGANPFTRLAQYGIALELPPAALPPDAPVIRNLVTMWSRLMKPN